MYYFQQFQCGTATPGAAGKLGLGSGVLVFGFGLFCGASLLLGAYLLDEYASLLDLSLAAAVGEDAVVAYLDEARG